MALKKINSFNPIQKKEGGKRTLFSIMNAWLCANVDVYIYECTWKWNARASDVCYVEGCEHCVHECIMCISVCLSVSLRVCACVVCVVCVCMHGVLSFDCVYVRADAYTCMNLRSRNIFTDRGFSSWSTHILIGRMGLQDRRAMSFPTARPVYHLTLLFALWRHHLVTWSRRSPGGAIIAVFASFYFYFFFFFFFLLQRSSSQLGLMSSDIAHRLWLVVIVWYTIVIGWHRVIPQSHLIRRPYGLTFLRSVEILRPPQYFYGYIP